MRRRHGSSSKRQLALSRRAVLLLRDLNEAWWQNAECSNLQRKSSRCQGALRHLGPLGERELVSLLDAGGGALGKLAWIF